MLDDGRWRVDAAIGAALGWFGGQGAAAPSEQAGGADTANGAPLGLAGDKAVRELLYHVEHLRKRPGGED